MSDDVDPIFAPKAEDGSASASSRKRRRPDSSQSERDSADGLGAQVRAARNIGRDEAFYFDDGSCVLLVENTLFNVGVHRTMLSKDGSSFKMMFTLPQGSEPTEGTSDDIPIHLTGDSAKEFRNFLGALYALPPEMRALATDVSKLIDIARISNKYAFKSLETWALDAIQEYINHRPTPMPPFPFPFFTQPSLTATPILFGSESETITQLTRLMRLAQMCNHERLLNTMIGLLRQLMTTSPRYAYLAMSLSDELALRSLRGEAYLEVMHKTVVVKKGHAELGDIDEEGRLVVSSTEQLRLLTGYYRLSRAWERLRLTAPPIDHSPSCNATWHQPSCSQSWVEFWKEKTRGDAVLSLGLADVLGRLKQVQKDFDRWGSATYMHQDCRLAARRSILHLIKTVEDRLPDYFSEERDE
ncbi:uncharacterized protein BT62DRAFT_969398 [Guyanagaster necrorhizus]|uniref:BTB domain-containing protein n=1 Tax=Guyanagaster necrorhizus TaxID=856835 RepID=A0A9P7VTA7_9AGAR|nr:uncharacterized protein BT62DRAFT_969398 [Guyanagaster necrorhizus MCA 3950]KAG7445694.1 hypothetical protein BT62DRAFT_969398 [Guyanagaster necrorhizus MCA 3950]